MSRPHAVGREGVVSTTTVPTPTLALVSCDDLQERLVRPMTGFFMFRFQPLVITSTTYHHDMDFTCAFTRMGLSYRYLFRRICTCSQSCLGRARAGVSPPDVRPAAEPYARTAVLVSHSSLTQLVHSIVIPNRVQVCPGGPVPMPCGYAYVWRLGTTMRFSQLSHGFPPNRCEFRSFGQSDIETCQLWTTFIACRRC